MIRACGHRTASWSDAAPQAVHNSRPLTVFRQPGGPAHTTIEDHEYIAMSALSPKVIDGGNTGLLHRRKPCRRTIVDRAKLAPETFECVYPADSIGRVA